jgi:hypothetical protein
MPSKLNISSALNAAKAVHTEEKAGITLEKKARPVSLRMNESDHNRFRSLFAKSGLNLSEGCIASITYVAEMVEAGAFTISKSGVQDVRGRRG